MLFLLQAALAPATRIAYLRAWTRLCEFSRSHYLPLSRITLAKFVTHLYALGLNFATINAYLSGIAFWLKILGFPAFTDDFLVRKLVAGIKKLTQKPDTRVPISAPLLREMIKALPLLDLNRFDVILYTAMFSWAYFACLRVSEYAEGGHSQHTLRLEDIDFAGSLAWPLAFRINFKSYKWSKGPTSRILTRVTDQVICPVLNMVRYLSVRGNAPGCLFLSSEGPVTIKKVSDLLDIFRTLLPDVMKLSSHCFRIGRCTDLHEAGVSESEIMAKGRWTSASYKVYVRPAQVYL